MLILRRSQEIALTEAWFVNWMRRHLEAFEFLLACELDLTRLRGEMQ